MQSIWMTLFSRRRVCRCTRIRSLRSIDNQKRIKRQWTPFYTTFSISQMHDYTYYLDINFYMLASNSSKIEMSGLYDSMSKLLLI